MHDTLTLMRLGITGHLATTLCSTNPCESMIEIVRSTQRNVKRWQDGGMRKPWTAAEMLAAEQQFRRIIGYARWLGCPRQRTLRHRIRDLRLHAASGAHFRIPDAKTEAGIREVQVSPDLLEEIVAYIDRLRRAGQPIDPDAHLFPNRKGRRMTRQRVGEIVRDAAKLASTHLAARGLPALPNTSPHTLRRTYISIALLANRFDVLWVMRQVGHADSHMTMDVYAQLQQRAERQHGEAFDGLVRRARERLYGTVEEAAGDDGEPEEEPRLEDLVDEWRDERDDP